MASTISPKISPIIATASKISSIVATSSKVPFVPTSSLHHPSKIIGPASHSRSSTKIASTTSLGSSTKVATSTLEAARWRSLSLLLLLLPSSYSKISCQHISHCIFTSLNCMEERAARQNWNDLAFCHNCCCCRLQLTKWDWLGSTSSGRNILFSTDGASHVTIHVKPRRSTSLKWSSKRSTWSTMGSTVRSTRSTMGSSTNVSFSKASLCAPIGLRIGIIPGILKASWDGL